MHHAPLSTSSSSLRLLRQALLVLALGSLGCEKSPGVHSYVLIGDPEPPAATDSALTPSDTRSQAAATLPPEASSEVRRAAQAALIGQLDRARAELSHLRPEHPDFPRVLFVHACISLESGDLSSAERDIASLRQLLPERPEPRILETLLSLRREQPALGWRAAFLQAWNAAGRPDLEEQHLFDDLWDYVVTPSFEDAWRRTQAPDTRLMLALAAIPASEEQARFVLQHLASIDEPAWAVAAFEILQQDSLPKAFRAQAIEAMRSRLDTLSAASPDNMALRVLRLLGATELTAPFTPAELQQLEALSLLPEWRTSDFARTFSHARQLLEQAGLSPSAGHAYSAAVATLAGQGPYVLLKRAQVSLEHLAPAERQRLGEILWRIGSRLAAESSVLERLLGYNLMRHGALALEDEARVQQVASLSQPVRDSLDASRRASTDGWPLHSLAEDMLQASVTHEVSHLAGFLPPEPASPREP